MFAIRQDIDLSKVINTLNYHSARLLTQGEREGVGSGYQVFDCLRRSLRPRPLTCCVQTRLNPFVQQPQRP
ncbi:MAG: hypothetical protein ACKERG_00675 [Candidatus Hodgkinia cicadicola]